eukprot:2333428-Amphidinium_carterae.1
MMPRNRWLVTSAPNSSSSRTSIDNNIVPQDDIDATVVALQSELEGEESFMPYRAVPRCCQSHEQWKQQMIEEAER